MALSIQSKDVWFNFTILTLIDETQDLAILNIVNDGVLHYFLFLGARTSTRSLSVVLGLRLASASVMNWPLTESLKTVLRLPLGLDMADILQFKPREQEPERLVWLCNCGSLEFWLYDDGTIKCAKCNVEATELEGCYFESLGGASIQTP